MRIVAAHQLVTLRLGEHDHYRARVEAAEDGHVTLALFTDPDRSLAGAVGVVEFVDPRGVHRIEGVLVEGAERSVVRLNVTADPERIQRRDYVRVEAVVPVSLGDGVSTYTLNVSGGGALLAGPEHLNAGDEFTMRLSLPDHAIEAKGAVVRETGDGHKAVRFAEITDAAREHVIRFVFDRERRSAHVRTQ